jgi:hypothetical protein
VSAVLVRVGSGCASVVVVSVARVVFVAIVVSEAVASDAPADVAYGETGENTSTLCRVDARLAAATVTTVTKPMTETAASVTARRRRNRPMQRL